MNISQIPGKKESITARKHKKYDIDNKYDMNYFFCIKYKILTWVTPLTIEISFKICLLSC